jgi:hypothetical protein
MAACPGWNKDVTPAYHTRMRDTLQRVPGHPPTFAAGLVVVAAAALLTNAAARGQGTVDVGVVGGGGGAAVVQVPNPDDPAVRTYAATQKQRVAAEREMRKLRAEYFDNIRNTEIRQIGISKLRQYADRPFLYPALLREFARCGEDVRGAILDLFADQQSDEGDTTLAWTAIFDKDEGWRAMAAERLQRRIKDPGEATTRMKQVIAHGLRRDSTEKQMAAAARLASQLNVLEVIPLLIAAQAGGTQTTTARVGGDGDTSLAYILVGTQTAYVADLDVVVGDNAVAFDPQLAVITEGTYLRIISAHVITYRTEVHSALVDITSRAWGRPTGGFGYDQDRWAQWYKSEFLPHLAKLAEENAAQDPAR